jgi:hypothetical protein
VKLWQADNAGCSASYQGAFERLERSDAKVSRAVLRGRGASNGPLLPDQYVKFDFKFLSKYL